MIFPLVTLINDSINSNLSKRAITYHDGDSWCDVSYADIKDAVNQIQSLLKGKVLPNQTAYVLLHLNVTVSYPSIVLGVLNAGLGFICIDPEDNDAIYQYIQENSIKYIISNIYFNESHQKSFPFDAKCEESLLVHGETLGLWMTCNDRQFDKISFIYAIKTSGTTGKAKTVHVMHECIFPNLKDISTLLQVSSTDVIMLMTPITFDPSVIELFLALMNGSTLCIVKKYIKQNPDLLLDILFPAAKEGLVTILQTTPSLFRRWNKEALQNRIFADKSMLKNLILGGEEFPSENELKSWGITGNINIYNIYGITEVSCWASIKRVWPAKKIEIDIGTPFSETLFKLETDRKNEGELFIGSKTRKCLINDEACETLCNNDILFRPTGDIFKKVNGKLFFKRRKDDILKRWGTKFSASSIEECVKLHENIIACVCTTCKIDYHIRIGLFIIEKNSSDLKDLKCFLKKNLPKASWPDSITALDSFPLTTHGKVCLRSLQKMLLESKTPKSKDTFYKMWRHYSSESASGSNDFFSDGGDSLMALQLVAELKQNFNDVPDTILGMILQKKTCHELWTYIADQQGNSIHKAKKNMLLTSFCNEVTKARTTNISKLLLKGKISILVNYISNDYIIQTDLNLIEAWKLNLGKCIDASPLGIQLSGGEKLCIIGSHSGRVVVLDIDSGKIISECILPDRVESSACISLNAEIYYIGCYDGCVYAVSCNSGKIIWKFKTEDMVKSTCLIFKDYIVFGSYDRKMYCLLEDGLLKWKTLLRSPILADPVLHNNTLYSATLGSIAVLNSMSGQLLWELKHEPIFSTPVLNNSYLILADVTGSVKWLNIKNGLEEFVFKTDDIIFSSLVKCNINEDEIIIFGCNDGFVYCLKERKLHWKSFLHDRIVSTPFVEFCSTTFYGSVVCFTAKGELFILNISNGEKLSHYSLPGEVFSSPIVMNRKIIVGCRDDNIYCLAVK